MLQNLYTFWTTCRENLILELQDRVSFVSWPSYKSYRVIDHICNLLERIVRGLLWVLLVFLKQKWIAAVVALEKMQIRLTLFFIVWGALPGVGRNLIFTDCRKWCNRNQICFLFLDCNTYCNWSNTHCLWQYDCSPVHQLSFPRISCCRTRLSTRSFQAPFAAQAYCEVSHKLLFSSRKHTTTNFKWVVHHLFCMRTYFALLSKRSERVAELCIKFQLM